MKKRKKRKKRAQTSLTAVEEKRSFSKFVTKLEAIGLFGRIEARAVNMHVSLQDLYEGPYSTSVVAARRSVYSWLLQEGKTVNEVAVLFDRSPSGVAKLMAGKTS